jgi:hypothetical protein
LLRDKTRKPGKPPLPAETVQLIIDLVTGPPPGEATHKRGVFRSVADLEDAINRFVEETNSHPKPFVWTARPNRILAAVKRGKEKLDSIH